MKINIIILILLMLELFTFLTPIIKANCPGTYPYCCSGCDAKDLSISFVYLTSENKCTGGIGYADLHALVHAPTQARYCFHLAYEVEQPPNSGTWIRYDQGYGTVSGGDYDFLLVKDIQYPCDSVLAMRNIHADWAPNSACVYNSCNDYVPAKCYDNAGPIYVYSPLVTDFTFNNACLGSPTQFISTTSGGLPSYSYLWNFGDGNSATVQSPTWTYAVRATYNACLTATDSQPAPSTYTDSKCKDVPIGAAKPIPNIGVVIS
jgi:PKD repeat protein